MEKIIFLTLLLSLNISSNEPPELLQNNCLNCHRKQKIPSELIYRRYLMQYSTNERIEKQLIPFLTNPIKENSIMPKQFFLKFPAKEVSDLNETKLKESIEAYLNYFDIKKRLKIE